MRAKPCVISPILATRSFDARPLSTRPGSKPGKDADVAKTRLSPPERVRRPWKGISTRTPTHVQNQHMAEGIPNPGRGVYTVRSSCEDRLMRRTHFGERQSRLQALPPSWSFRGLWSGILPCLRGLMRAANQQQPGCGCEGNRPGELGFNLGSDSSRVTSCPG